MSDSEALVWSILLLYIILLSESGIASCFLHYKIHGVSKMLDSVIGFIQLVFPYQNYAAQKLRWRMKKSGIVILVAIITVFALPANLILFVFYSLCKLAQLVCRLYMKIFKY